MIKNRTVQIIFQTIYCTLAVIGFFNSFGYFDAKFFGNFYVYYTNLSNYICMGFMIAVLISTIKHTKEDGYCNTSPRFNFCCVVMIAITFLIYNVLLAKDFSVVNYFTSLNNILMHIILPIMFILNWVLFYEHKKAKWYWPLLCLIMPIIYLIFILIRAVIIGNKPGALLYPYFFLNITELGWGRFFMWLGILLVIFLAISYLFVAIDHFIKNKKK